MTTKMESTFPKTNDTRKRLMYVTKDDFYFLTYNAFLLLSELKCTKKENTFADLRKLSFTVEFTSNYSLVKTLLRCKTEGRSPTNQEKALLTSVYVRGKSRLAFINRLMTGLEKKGYVQILPNNDKKILDVYLNLEKIPPTFFDKDLFESEIDNIKRLKKISSEMHTTSLSAFLKTMFQDNGVSTCLD